MNQLVILIVTYICLISSLKGCSHSIDKKEDQSCYKTSTGEVWCLDELEEH